VYGYVKIPLHDLSMGLKISGRFPVEDSKGQSVGNADICMYWQEPYHLQAQPV
jgi:hypothetical protein